MNVNFRIDNVINFNCFIVYSCVAIDSFSCYCFEIVDRHINCGDAFICVVTRNYSNIRCHYLIDEVWYVDNKFEDPCADIPRVLVECGVHPYLDEINEFIGGL